MAKLDEGFLVLLPRLGVFRRVVRALKLNPKKELLQCDNVVVTPHVAGRAPESRTAATALILANLNAHFAGKPLPSPVSITA